MSHFSWLSRSFLIRLQNTCLPRNTFAIVQNQAPNLRINRVNFSLKVLSGTSSERSHVKKIHKETSMTLFQRTCNQHIFQIFRFNSDDKVTESKDSESDNVRKESVDKTELGQMEPKMQIAYTCKVCNSRNHQTFSRKSYQEGVVIVKCKGCSNNHLIADNLGWFKDIKHSNIEEILAAKGEEISKITTGQDGHIEVQAKEE